MSIDHIDLICEALGCDIADLIEIVPNKEPRVKTRIGAPQHPSGK